MKPAAIATARMSSPTPIRLTFELVPASSWYRNVRANVSPSTWATLQRVTFMAAGNRCEICSSVGPRHPVECHEVWQYDDTLLLQRLERLVALCPDCHRVKHIGHTLATGARDAVETAIAWFCRVNSTLPSVALQHLQDAFAVQASRSRYKYQLDVKLLRTYGVRLDANGIETGHRPTLIDY